MREVNEAAMPALTRLAEGEWWELSEPERQAVSTWATMTSMTWEFADPETQASRPEDRRDLMNNRRPPDHWQLWLAGYAGTTWVRQHNHKGMHVGILEIPEERTTNVHVQVFTWGKVVFLTHSSRALLPVNMRAIAEVNLAAQIWPAALQLPDKLEILNDQQVDRLAHGIVDVYQDPTLRRSIEPGLAPFAPFYRRKPETN